MVPLENPTEKKNCFWMVEKKKVKKKKCYREKIVTEGSKMNQIKKSEGKKMWIILLSFTQCEER